MVSKHDNMSSMKESRRTANTEKSRASFPRFQPRSFGGVFLLSMLIVVGLTVSTTVIVNLAVSPWLLGTHIRDAQLPGVHQAAIDAQVMKHVEIAARTANAIALGISLLIGLGAAIGSSLYLSHQMNAGVSGIVRASKEIAGGNYDTHVEQVSLGEEMAIVVDSFNAMVERLKTTEMHRRRLFSDLAHEIRTPVSVIRAQAEAIEDGIVSIQNSSSIFQAQAERLVALSDDLSLLSRAEEGSLPYHMHRLDLVDIARTAVDSMTVAFSTRHVYLKLDTPSTAISVVADRQRLLQVLANLLNNALHATTEGDDVQVCVTQSKGFASLSVTDTGKGMTADQIAPIFERLYRIEGSRSRQDGGSGIGLAISRQIMVAHRGTLSATSKGLGKGSTFTLTIPTTQT
ncbi:sensor histidine kinase [Bifidobacterium fermentum]|uniref:histidine kinase n=1 Tax=Bifidobacterium fermentum TaxID=3059035 RepID=A0AB39UHM4_9BIFI